MLEIDELNAWVERSRRWANGGQTPQITVGEDEAGPWFEIPESGPDVMWCLQPLIGRPGGVCRNRAGMGTGHRGAGPCWMHDRTVANQLGLGRARESADRLGAWIMAHGFATALHMSPMEGLLWAVRIAAGRVAWIEAKLATAVSDRQLEPASPDAIEEAGRVSDQGGTNLYHWVKESEKWQVNLAKVSKLAIDAGVAAALVRQLELEATLMLRAANRTFDAIGLDESQKELALGIMSRELVALESAAVSEGEGE